MRGPRLLIVCTAACSSPHGVAIEVHPGATTANQVELFIGRTPCHEPDCGGIQPPGVNGTLPGSVFYRDGNPIDSAPMVDGVATFQLLPDQTAETLPIVIAVGFIDTDRGPAPNAVAIVTDLALSAQPEIIYATLSGATSHIVSLPAAMPIDDGDRVEVWRETAAPSTSCVAVQRWRNNAPEQVFVVPVDDPDCDDVPNGPLECDQDAFHASTAPTSIGDVSCVAQFSAGGVPVCRLGGPGCTDGQGTVSCAPSPYCLPDAVCAAADPCVVPDPVCLEGRLANAPNTARLHCKLPTELGQPCASGATATVDLSMVFAPAMATCSDVSFYTVLTGGAKLQFSDTLRFADGVELVPTMPIAPCMFDVSWVNHQATDPTGSDRGLIQIDIDNGQHVIVPIVVEYLPGACGTMPMSCTPFYGSMPTGGIDNVWSCVD